MTPESPSPEAIERARLVHDLSNPLSAVLAEAQLLLMDEKSLSPTVIQALRAIESAALRMRSLLRESGTPRST